MDDLRERLAHMEHQRWSSWMKHQFDHWDEVHIKQWKRQMNTPYSELTEKEKDSDRREADKTLTALGGYFFGMTKTEVPERTATNLGG